MSDDKRNQPIQQDELDKVAGGVIGPTKPPTSTPQHVGGPPPKRPPGTGEGGSIIHPD